jgi:hypothetical protein
MLEIEQGMSKGHTACAGVPRSSTSRLADSQTAVQRSCADRPQVTQNFQPRSSSLPHAGQ